MISHFLFLPVSRLWNEAYPEPAVLLSSRIPPLKFLVSHIPPRFLASSRIPPNLCWTLRDCERVQEQENYKENRTKYFKKQVVNIFRKDTIFFTRPAILNNCGISIQMSEYKACFYLNRMESSFLRHLRVGSTELMALKNWCWFAHVGML